MKAIRFIALLLMVIGALNWGLVGFFHYNLISDVFSGAPGFVRFIFAIVGLAGLYGLGCLFRCCCACQCGSGCGCCKKK